MLTERRFDTGSITVNYAAGPPAGPPLVLLHGFMGRWQDWLLILPALSREWRVLAPDLRGHGGTDPAPDGVYRHGDVLADLLAFLEEVVGESAVVFGHSAGVPGAVEAAVRRPDLVRALVLGDFSLDFRWLADLVHRPGMVAFHLAIRDLAGREVVDLLPALAALRPDLDGDRLCDWAESLHHLDPRVMDCHAEGRLEDLYGDIDGDALLAAVICPTLILQSDPACGGLLADDHAQRALASLVQGALVRLAGIDHDLGLSPGETGPLLEAVTSYLSRVLDG